MNRFAKVILGTALGLVIASTAMAQNKVNADVSNTSTTNAVSQTEASNQGVSATNNFNTTSPEHTSTDVHYSGVTGSNTAVGLGSFSSSFSSDYCGGTQQAGISVPYATLAAGGPVLKEPGVACVNTRAAVHTMEFSATFGNAAARALALADDAKKRNDAQAALAYQDSAASFAAMSGKLAQASVNMLCNLSDDVRQAYRDAGVSCPETKLEKAAADKQQAVAHNEPVDPLIRQRMGLASLK